MSRNPLNPSIVAERMIRLRNLEKLYKLAKQRHNIQNKQIAILKQLSDSQQELLSKQLILMEDQAIRIAELETMVFGKKKRPPTGTPSQQDIPNPSSKAPRSQDSFKRAIPGKETITETVPVPVDRCVCGGALTNIATHERYIEDIPLPALTVHYIPKIVSKYLVERGICERCGKPTAGRDLGGSVVSLGSNVRLLVCHLIAGLGMSYAQVVNLLLSLYGFTITDSEIARIIQKQHRIWQPAYQGLLTEIRGSPVVHSDETPWPIQDLQGHGYAWNLSDALSLRVCFALENSRGVIHAKKLFGVSTGQPFAGVRISDDYGAYRSTDFPGQQQLCWAHLYRCIRDLRYNDNLAEEQLPYVSWWYEQFAIIYEDLRVYLADVYDSSLRKQQTIDLWQRVQALAVQPVPLEGEPQKLKRLKAQLKLAGQAKLFACLMYDTPCDNNRAERDLRQLVVKRKCSLGSKSEKGAHALATALSLCTTYWRMNPDTYFQALAGLG
jgi:transposase